MSTPVGSQWYLASAARLTALAILCGTGSVFAGGWLGFLLSMTSVALAIVGTVELGRARRRRATMGVAA
jgi:hypothetical protein